VQEKQLPKTPSARAPNYQSGRASDRPVEAFKRSCPEEAVQQVPELRFVQEHARQETAQRTSASTPTDITGGHVTIAAQSSSQSERSSELGDSELLGSRT